uniref:(northern house mosquito) hypothetical protein n=1 Tax=Culex pipiens TaxID=7175 RepID=A0A8D8KAE3_CULPI
MLAKSAPDPMISSRFSSNTSTNSNKSSSSDRVLRNVSISLTTSEVRLYFPSLIGGACFFLAMLFLFGLIVCSIMKSSSKYSDFGKSIIHCVASGLAYIHR